tara:strand:- start:914 stop:1090 length:177 start_codon:yes stop_codon:yes gene_type:complete
MTLKQSLIESYSKNDLRIVVGRAMEIPQEKLNKMSRKKLLPLVSKLSLSQIKNKEEAR